MSGRHFNKAHKGASLTGYGLVVGLIAILAIAAVTSVGDGVRSLFGLVDLELSEATGSGSSGGSGSSTPLGSVSLAFIDTGAPLGATMTSNIEAISGLGGTASISISGDGSPRYRICSLSNCSDGAVFTSTAGSVSDGDYVQLENVASSVKLETRTATLTIESQSFDWSLQAEGDTFGYFVGRTSLDSANAPTALSNGDILTVGQTQSSPKFGGTRDGFLLRFGGDGAFKGAANFGGTADDSASDGGFTSNGAIAFGGNFFPDAQRDGMIGFFDNSADVPAISQIRAIDVDSDDRMFRTKGTNDGGLLSVGGSSVDGLVVKLDSSGNVDFALTYDAGDDEFMRDFVELSGGGFIMVGSSGADGIVIKTDADGVVEAAITLGSASFSEGIKRVSRMQNGNFALAGNGGASSADAVVWVIDSDLNLVSTTTVGGTGEETVEGMAVLTDGRVGLSARTTSGGVSGTDGLLIVLNSTATALDYARTINVGSFAMGTGLTRTSDGMLVFSGRVDGTGVSGLGSRSVLLVKIHEDGTMDQSCPEITSAPATAVLVNNITAPDTRTDVTVTVQTGTTDESSGVYTPTGIDNVNDRTSTENVYDFCSNAVVNP